MAETVSPGGHGGASSGGGGGGTQIVDVQKFGGSTIGQGQDIAANSIPVVLASDASILIDPASTVLATFGAGSAIIGKVGIDQTTDGTTNAVHLVAGTAVIGHVINDASSAVIGHVITDATSVTQLVPGTSGGLSLTSTLHGNNVTAIVVKSGAGQLYAIAATNNSAVYGYLKIYNATSATAGSGTPVDRILIPAPAAGGGGGIIWSVPAGVAYSTGITYCLTGLVADNDTTAPAASSFTVTFYYK